MAAMMAGKAKNIEKNITYGTTNQLSVSDNGLWLREDREQSDGNAYVIIHAPQIISSNPIILKNVSYLTFTPNGINMERIDAETALLAKDKWVIKNAWLLNKEEKLKNFRR